MYQPLDLYNTFVKDDDYHYLMIAENDRTSLKVVMDVVIQYSDNL